MSGGAGLVIAVDCSTTAVKAVIYDEAGQVVAQAAHPLRTLQPRPAWHEQDAVQWWTATQGAIAEAVGALVDPGRVRALCITHQRESFVCLDSGGPALRRARRRVALAQRWAPATALGLSRDADALRGQWVWNCHVVDVANN